MPLRKPIPARRPRRPRAGRARARAGFSLVEALLSSVIVATLVATSVGTFGAVAKSRRMRADRQQASALASQFMAEVLQAKFAAGTNNAGYDTGEVTGNKRYLDDVDDYHNWSEKPPRDRDGKALVGFGDWTRSCKVEYVDPATPDTVSNVATTLKRVAVTVKSPRGGQVTVYALRSSAGLYEATPGADTTYVTWTGVELRVGATARPIQSGAHPMNLKWW